jgi:septum formation protein
MQQEAATMRIILASSSPRRQELLAQLGLDFEVIKPDIDESRLAAEDLVQYAERLSREKAAAVQASLDGRPAIIIAADTIVIDHDGELLGKPVDAADARRMLRHLRARAHHVVTAFTVYRNSQPPQAYTSHARTAVYMRAYTEPEIDAYIASGDPFDKAGGYAIQHDSFQPAQRIEGSYSNVVGLPLEALRKALRDFRLAVVSGE